MIFRLPLVPPDCFVEAARRLAGLFILRKAGQMALERQIWGIITLSMILALLPLAGYFYPASFSPPILSKSRPDSLAIELDAENGTSGVFFVKPQTTARELFDSLSVGALGFQDFLLQNAMKIRLVSRDGKALVFVEKMALEKRLALGLPIDLNSATEKDLVLVSGLGPKMAAAIVARRSEIGHFATLEQLTSIKGLKEKKLAKLRPYLCIENQKNGARLPY